MSTVKPGMRAADPDFAAFIDGLRAEFGADAINQAMKDGIAGIPGRFHYTGPAGEIGTPFRASHPAKTISAADMALHLKPKTATPTEIIADAHRTARHK